VQEESKENHEFLFAEKPVSWSVFQKSTIQTGHKIANHYIATNTASEKRILYSPGWMASIDVQHIGEAIFTFSLDRIIIGKKGM
jgi:hypothetical protein